MHYDTFFEIAYFFRKLLAERDCTYNDIKYKIIDNQEQFEKLIEIIKFIPLFCSENKVLQVDTDFTNLIKVNKLVNYTPVLTQKDGNCFYRSISMQLFGKNNHYESIKACSVYVLVLHENFFRSLFEFSDHETQFEQFVLNTLRQNEWANQFNILSVSILLNRPIYVYLENSSKKKITTESYKYLMDGINEDDPIAIGLKNNHFVPFLKKNHTDKPNPIDESHDFFRREKSKNFFI